MAGASSSSLCFLWPCSSSCATHIAAPHHDKDENARARRGRSKSSELNASKSCSFRPVSPIDCYYYSSSSSSVWNASVVSSSSSHLCHHHHPRGHPPQSVIDVRSRRSSASSVNCICCGALVNRYHRFIRGRRCDGEPLLLEEEEGNNNGGSCCSNNARGGSSSVSSRRRWLSLQNLIPFQIGGSWRNNTNNSNTRQVLGIMKAGTSVAPPIVKQRSRLSPGDPLSDDYVEDDPTKTGPERRAGILLHPTSLPGSFGIGELGDEALHFLDWLKGAGCTVWQVLPLVPPGRKSGEDGSPYAGQDANCGNTLLISLEELVKWGLLEKSDLPRRLPVNRVDYDAVAKVKDPLIVKAAQKLLVIEGGLRLELEKFRKNPSISAWLEEAALFAAIDSSIDAQFWWNWPAPLRDRDPKALEAARKEHKQFIDEFIAQQFLFQRQWQAVHKYAREQGIRIIGDMPIYVGGHSADVWAHRGSFMLDEKSGVPTFVSGVPPDAFSATGQLWGSPLYNWKAMAKDNYAWWAMRMKRAYELYDEFRIDHFRGLAGYWAIKADEETALNGSWQVGPRLAFFDAIQKAVGKIDIIAEDLGVITSDVVELRRAIKAPGMAVLQFARDANMKFLLGCHAVHDAAAFGSDPQNPHMPHNHEIEQVVYPGTHDNDTVKGWWVKLPEDEKESVRAYLRLKDNEDNISWDFIRATFSSVARTAIIPMQDVLSLDNSARMNTPAVQAGNWGWRVGETGVFTKLDKERDQLRAMLKYYNRTPRRIYCPI